MLIRMIFGIVACLLCAQTTTAQHAESAVPAVELLAAKAAVQRSLGAVTPGLRVVVHSAIVRAGQAPGVTDSTERSAQRNAQLARGLGAKLGRWSGVVDCSSRTCELRGADLLLTLSQPVINGKNAKVTVTTVQPVTHPRAMNRIQYKTVNVLLKWRGSAWQVIGFEDLGIS